LKGPTPVNTAKHAKTVQCVLSRPERFINGLVPVDPYQNWLAEAFKAYTRR